MRKRVYERKLKDLPRGEEIHEPDWAAIVLLLAGKGYPRTRIARYCDTTREHIDRIMQGGTTRIEWYCGQRLIQLHKAVTGEQCA